MSYRAADAYVSVTADDSGLAADLRSKVEAAVAEIGEAKAAEVPFRADTSALAPDLTTGLAEAVQAAAPLAGQEGYDAGTLVGAAFGRSVTEEAGQSLDLSAVFHGTGQSGLLTTAADSGRDFGAVFGQQAADGIQGISAILHPGSPVAGEIETQAHDAGTLVGGAFGRTVSQEAREQLTAALPDIFRGTAQSAMMSGAMDLGQGFAATFSQEAAASIRFADVFSALPVGAETAAIGATAAIETALEDGAGGVEEALEEPMIEAKKKASESGEESGDLLMKAMLAGVLVGSPAVIGAIFAGLPIALQAAGTEIQTLTGKSIDLGAVMQIAAAQTDELKLAAADAAADAIPGLTTAMQRDTPIVSAMGTVVQEVGSSVGSAFASMTVNAGQTAEGITASGHIIGTAVTTVGQLFGNLASTVGPALSGVTGSVDGLLGAVGRLSAVPGVMGGITGAFAAWQLDGPISKGLGSASSGLLTLSERTEGASGLTDAFSGAALKGAAGLSTMADVMGGPWGIAIGAGIGLLGGWIESGTKAIATASDFTQAISQDSDMVGASTEATIANILAKTNLSAVAQTAGVSEQQLIEYASGDKQAQEAVTAAFNAKIAALASAAGSTTEYGKATVQVNNAQQTEINNVNAAKAALDKLTGAVASALNEQTLQNQALLAAEKATNVFGAEVKAAEVALAQQNETLLINATALNGSLAPQAQLTGAAVAAEVAYQGASSATGAYTNALTALYGKYGDTSDAQAALTTGLAGLTGNITKGTDAVNLSTAAGAKNFTAFYQVAQEAETYSEKLYQQTGNAGLANQALQQSATALDTAATKAHLTSTQVAQLNTELFGVPSVKNIKISADTSQAESELQKLLGEIADADPTLLMTIETTTTKQLGHGGSTAGASVAVGGLSQGGGVMPQIVALGSSSGAAVSSQGGQLIGGSASGGDVNIYIGSMPLTMTGFADFTNPNAMSVAARRQAIDINNALVQVANSRTGASR